MLVLSPGALGKGQQIVERIVFLKKVCVNKYVGAAVKIGVVDRTTTTTIGRWTPPS